MEDFQEPGVNRTVQEVRYNHYCEKRLRRHNLHLPYPLENLEHLEGMVRARLVGATTLLHGHDSNSSLQQHSLSRVTQDPSIPLREPLEFEYRVNRKLARKIYAQEKQERVLSNKGQHQLENMQRMQTLVNEYSEKEKKFLKELRTKEEIQ